MLLCAFKGIINIFILHLLQKPVSAFKRYILFPLISVGISQLESNLKNGKNGKFIEDFSLPDMVGTC